MALVRMDADEVGDLDDTTQHWLVVIGQCLVRGGQGQRRRRKVTR